MITYTYKAKLSATTHQNLQEFLAQLRLLYNGALYERIDGYQKTGKSISFFDQCYSLTELRRDDEWFRKFDRMCQHTVLRRVDCAFQRFFKEGFGFPRYKSVQRSVTSFETTQKKPTFKNKYCHIKLKGIGRFRWRQDGRCIDPKQVKVVRVVRGASGIFIQLVCDVEPRRLGLNEAIGIDVGVYVRAALSDGTVFERHTPNRAEIRRKQRALSRCQPRSNQRMKRRQALARACYRAKVRRHNAVHRVTSDIIKHHGKWIAVEDLNIRAMTASAKGTVANPGRRVKQKAGLNRAILDQNWGMFINQLNYKAASAGGQLVRVDPRHTTQRCARCGELPVKPLSLDDRWYHCTHCGNEDDRDVNAAKNVLLKGRVLFGAGAHFPQCRQLKHPIRTLVSCRTSVLHDIGIDRHRTV